MRWDRTCSSRLITDHIRSYVYQDQIATSTMLEYHHCGRAMLRWAKKRRLFTDLTKKRNKIRRVLTEEELEAFF